MPFMLRTLVSREMKSRMKHVTVVACHYLLMRCLSGQKLVIDRMLMLHGIRGITAPYCIYFSSFRVAETAGRERRR